MGCNASGAEGAPRVMLHDAKLLWWTLLGRSCLEPDRKPHKTSKNKRVKHAPKAIQTQTESFRTLPNLGASLTASLAPVPLDGSLGRSKTSPGCARDCCPAVGVRMGDGLV